MTISGPKRDTQCLGNSKWPAVSKEKGNPEELSSSLVPEEFNSFPVLKELSSFLVPEEFNSFLVLKELSSFLVLPVSQVAGFAQFHICYFKREMLVGLVKTI